MILVTSIAIIVYSCLYVKDNGWGNNVPLFNTETWLTMIGSAIYSYEGIGVVIPLLEVTENPKQFPKILFLVMLTVMVVYSGFGTFNLFVYGDKLEGVPVITSLLDQGAVVWVIKIAFSINVIFTYTLMIFPANIIIDHYMYGRMPKSRKRQLLKNLNRVVLAAFTVIVCILLGNKLDKFLSLIGTLASTPVSFTIPCVYHLRLCNPDRKGKIIDWSIIAFSFVILIFCSGFNIYTWND